MGRKCFWTSDDVNSYFPLYSGVTNSPTQWIDIIARWKTCSAHSPLVLNVIRLFAPAARRERLSSLAFHWGVGRRDGWYFILIPHNEQYAYQFLLNCVTFQKIKDQRPNDETDPWVDCAKQSGIFFPKSISAGIAWESHTKSASLTRSTGVGFQPRSRPFRSLTVHAYLATRKYRLACVCSLSSGSAYHIILSSWRSRALYHNTAKTKGWRSTPSPCVPLYGFEFASMSGS